MEGLLGHELWYNSYFVIQLLYSAHEYQEAIIPVERFIGGSATVYSCCFLQPTDNLNQKWVHFMPVG